MNSKADTFAEVKTINNKTMKQIKNISNGKNYNAISLGNLSELNEYVLSLSPDMNILGKVFIGRNLSCEGTEISFQVFKPGSETGFLHKHHKHEEIYVFIKGKGEYQVDGEIFPIGEGTVIRVSPDGERTVRNNGNDDMVMMCIQYKPVAFDESDAQDAVILQKEVKW